MEYYIILQGKTSIWYRSQGNNKDNENQAREIKILPALNLPLRERIKSNFNGVPKIGKPTSSKVKYTAKYGLSVEYGSSSMVKVDTIETGAFGELSLTQEGVGVRMASILAEEDTHFAVLEKKAYEVSVLFFSNKIQLIYHVRK